MANDGTIEMSVEKACMISERLSAAIDGYAALTLSSISETAPCTGSQIHDSEIKEQINSALCAWNTLVQSDAAAIVGAATELARVEAEQGLSFKG